MSALISKEYARRRTYAVLWGRKWARTNTFPEAKKLADKNNGVIYFLPYTPFASMNLDAPTFRRVGYRVPYTPKKTRD